jgi:hypothetical protein
MSKARVNREDEQAHHVKVGRVWPCNYHTLLFPPASPSTPATQQLRHTSAQAQALKLKQEGSTSAFSATMPVHTFTKAEAAMLQTYVEKFRTLKEDSHARGFVINEVFPAFLKAHPLGEPCPAFALKHSGQTAEVLWSRWSDHRRDVSNPVPSPCLYSHKPRSIL